MSLTPNYGMTIPASTDTVNLLTQNYPNFSILDTELKNVSNSSITVAVETKVGTVHNLVRSDSDRDVIRFTATSNYNAGDTFTVDGVTVTATTPAGTSVPSGAYVINSTVFAILDGTRLTVFAGGTNDANDVSYDNTGSGLTANDVQGAIDELKADIDNLDAGFVQVTGDGVKTFNDLYNELYALIDFTKITPDCEIIEHPDSTSFYIWKCVTLTPTNLEFSRVTNSASSLSSSRITLKTNSERFLVSYDVVTNTGSTVDQGTATSSIGYQIKLKY